MKKRIFSFLMALAMVLSLLPAASFAAETASGVCGSNLSWTLDDNGLLTISGTGEIPDYENSFDAPWSFYRESITEIVIEEGVTAIGESAFGVCFYVRRVVIPASVERIGAYAFYSSNNDLESVHISDLLAWCAMEIGREGNPLYSGADLYLNGEKVTEVVLPSVLSYVGNYAFSGCTSLTEVVLPEGVSSIGEGAFYECTNLRSITIPESVSQIGYTAFASCYAIESVFIEDIAAWCQITFGDEWSYAGSNPLMYGAALYLQGKRVENLMVPESVSAISPYAFYGCAQLTGLALPSNVKTIGSYAFYDCKDLTNVVIAQGLTSIGASAFSGCENLQSLNLPSSLLTIGRGAFDSCSALKSVVIPDSVVSLGARAFSGCSNLLSVTLPKKITSIETYTFYDCIRLKSVTIPEGVTSVADSAFYFCEGLQSLQLPQSLLSIGGYAFAGCEGLTQVTISPNVKTIDYGAFAYNSNLASVTIPASVTSIANNIFNDGSYRNLHHVLYTGSEARWETVSVDDRNEALFGAIFHYGCTGNEVKIISNSCAHAVIYCSICKKNFEIEKLGDHNYIDGVCIKCNDGDTVPLTAPAPKIYNKSASGQPYLYWDAVEGATQYEIYRATSKSGTYTKMYTTKNLYYNNTSAVAGKTYYYKICAVDADGNKSDYSVVKSITCDLAQPVNTKISIKAENGKPYLTWDAVKGATGYEIWRATSSSGTYTKMYTTSQTYYTNTSAKPSTTYYYRIKAVMSGNSYATSAYSATRSITCDCAAPSINITVKVDSGKPYLTWKAVDGATKYEIWRATSKDGTYTKMYTTSQTYYTNTSAKPGTTYYYKIKALGTSSYATSAYSNIRSITCDCARPVVTITTNSAGKPYLDWDAVDGAVKYEIWRATSADGTYTKMYTTSSSYYTNTGAVSGTTYYYKVVALGSTSYANSAYSNIVSVKAK